MIDTSDAPTTRPYLIRALYEWCTDNGFTPYLAVSVGDGVQVPREYVNDGQIVLNISFDATSALVLGNEFIEFKGRFSGVAREIVVPVCQVIGIYAKENGQGMAFPLVALKTEKPSSSSLRNIGSVQSAATAISEIKLVKLASVDSESRLDDPKGDPEPPRTTAVGTRPTLKRVK